LPVVSVGLHFAQIVASAKRATVSFQYDHTYSRVIRNRVKLGLERFK